MPSKPPEQDPKVAPKAFSFEDLRFKEIEVMADGILYEGTLIGADEMDLYMKGRLRWLILPLQKITSVRLAGEKESFDIRKLIDAGFYDPVNDEE